jgi:hypothetical protein
VRWLGEHCMQGVERTRCARACRHLCACAMEGTSGGSGVCVCARARGVCVRANAGWGVLNHAMHYNCAPPILCVYFEQALRAEAAMQTHGSSGTLIRELEGGGPCGLLRLVHCWFIDWLSTFV